MEQYLLSAIPGWSVVREIGQGSYGTVYEIVRNKFGIDEHCALKVVSIPSSQAEVRDLVKTDGLSEEAVYNYYSGLVNEFVQEIALMSKLKGNTNIVGYEDYYVIKKPNMIGWDILIRMELLEPLPDYIHRNSLSSRDIIKLGIDICNALEACSAQRVIHRDIKPDNIFVNQTGDFKLGDFGVARTIDKTVSGLSKKGTYTFMAPEVYRGEEYGPSVDVYSLGIVLYKLMNNNREPFLPPYPQQITYTDKNSALARRMNGEPLTPPVNASAEFSRVILKACSFAPANRYATSPELRRELLELLKNTDGIADAVLVKEIFSKSFSHDSAKGINRAAFDAGRAGAPSPVPDPTFAVRAAPSAPQYSAPAATANNKPANTAEGKAKVSKKKSKPVTAIIMIFAVLFTLLATILFAVKCAINGDNTKKLINDVYFSSFMEAHMQNSRQDVDKFYKYVNENLDLQSVSTKGKMDDHMIDSIIHDESSTVASFFVNKATEFIRCCLSDDYAEMYVEMSEIERLVDRNASSLDKDVGINYSIYSVKDSDTMIAKWFTGGKDREVYVTSKDVESSAGGALGFARLALSDVTIIILYLLAVGLYVLLIVRCTGDMKKVGIAVLVVGFVFILISVLPSELYKSLASGSPIGVLVRNIFSVSIVLYIFYVLFGALLITAAILIKKLQKKKSEPAMQQAFSTPAASQVSRADSNVCPVCKGARGDGDMFCANCGYRFV